MRFTTFAAAMMLALVAGPVLDVTVVGNQARAAEAENDLSVGTELVAVTDVSLHKAALLKGSKVSITKLLTRAGRIEGVAIALVDGHVVKVAIGMVREFFRVAGE